MFCCSDDLIDISERPNENKCTCFLAVSRLGFHPNVQWRSGPEVTTPPWSAWALGLDSQETAITQGTGPKNRGNVGMFTPQKQKQFVDLFEQLLPRSRFHFRLVIILALSSSDFVSIVVPRAASRLQMPMDGSGWW